MGQISREQYNEAPIMSDFVNNSNFPLGKQTHKGSSKVQKEGSDHKGKTILRFMHSSGTGFKMGAGDYRLACEKAGVSGIDAEGNILDVNSECVNGKYTIVA